MCSVDDRTGSQNTGERFRDETDLGGQESLCPAELVQSVVVDTQMMGQFMDERDPNLVFQFSQIGRHVAQL